MKPYVVCLRDHEAWWSEEDKAFIDNVFRATRYDQNEATLLVVKMKQSGVEAATDVAIVAGRRNYVVESVG
jgi:hypothetical protein